MDGSQLKAARLAAGLSARELAEAAGVSHRSIQRAEAKAVQQTTYRRYMDAAQRVLRQRLDALTALDL
jgi:transcriptional regulator with XRE-family HTH domain